MELGHRILKTEEPQKPKKLNVPGCNALLISRGQEWHQSTKKESAPPSHSSLGALGSFSVHHDLESPLYWGFPVSLPLPA